MLRSSPLTHLLLLFSILILIQAILPGIETIQHNGSSSKFISGDQSFHNIGSGNSWLSPIVAKDEFNSTDSSTRFNILDDESNSNSVKPQLVALRNLLLRISYDECCPSWKNITTDVDIIDELKRRHGKSRLPISFKGSDLIGELQITFTNITYLSIDGQPGDNERDKYYSFYDNLQYYLRLLKMAHDLLSQADTKESLHSDQQQHQKSAQEIDFMRKFRRQVRSLEFKAEHDPTLSSFLNEYIKMNSKNVTFNEHFNYYEEFLGLTTFGNYYAQNISLIRESVMAFNQICSHLMRIELFGNLTRPSKQYEIIRGMSFELYFIRNELINHISARILDNRNDVQRMFARLNDLTETRGYIRMLGDVFSSEPPEFGNNVRELTHILDLYLNNNMTQVSFYKALSDLPEDFILLGSSIAHHYEAKEVPHFTRFNAEYFSEQNPSLTQLNNTNNTNHTSNSKHADARQSNLSLFTRLFN